MLMFPDDSHHLVRQEKSQKDTAFMFVSTAPHE